MESKKQNRWTNKTKHTHRYRDQIDVCKGEGRTDKSWRGLTGADFQL